MGTPINAVMPAPQQQQAPAPATAPAYIPSVMQAVKPVEKTAVEHALPMISDWEKFIPDAYQDTKGNWTVGYGQTTIGNRKVVKGDKIDEPTARKWMEQRIAANDKTLSKYAGYASLTPQQKAAWLDIAYNTSGDFEKIGEDGKPKYGETLAALRDPKTIVKESQRLIPLYRRANGEIDEGLVNRRKDTLALFTGEMPAYVTKQERYEQSKKKKK